MDGSITWPLVWGVPLVSTLAVTALGYWLIAKSFKHQSDNRLYRQLAHTVLILLAIVTTILVLPFPEKTRAELLSLFGLVLTAVIALSSTTLASNAMAGLMLKATGAFRTGDFIRVEQHFGRVTTKALLHTGVQSQDRDIINLPNLYLINNPVQVVDQTGTLISADVGIGFDVHRSVVKTALLNAAENAGLTDAFVQIVEIGNFAVGYKVSGFLAEVGKIVTKRSELKAAVLDELHHQNIEVMTPSVMSQRPLPPDVPVIPVSHASDRQHLSAGEAEKVMFDKAELAARIEKFRAQCAELQDEIETLEEARDASEDESLHSLEIAWRTQQLSALRDIVTKFDNADE
ncbi:MAG: mechanosensitive ion channel domain-containing protein [Pseudomonadota bacterium]